MTFSGVRLAIKPAYRSPTAATSTVPPGSVDDLLIGAPQAASSAGAAYLVYGGTTLAGLATTTNGVTYINLINVGATGDRHSGARSHDHRPAGGSLTGSSVSSAGDFNDDGFADILIGSPGFCSSSTTYQSGRSHDALWCGQHLLRLSDGHHPPLQHPHGHPVGLFTGANAGDMAGYAALVGRVHQRRPAQPRS